MEPDVQPAPRRAGEPEAVFVVGVSRSGTTLMRSVLNSHSRLGIAPENHYLGHLLPGGGYRHAFRREGDLADDETIRRIVARIYSKAFQDGTWLRPVSPFWRWARRSVPPTELEQRLLAAPRTEAGQFDALMRTFADSRDRAIPGEKTPAHVAYVDELLAWFPGAKVIHMIRDPRGVFVSELRRRLETPTAVPYRWLVRMPPLFRAFVLLETVWAWAGAVADHRRLRDRHPDAYRLVRFEDLVRDPDGTVQELCDFLGVTPEPAMLEQEVTSRGAQLGQSGFDAGAADRWQATIDRGQAAWLERLLGRRLEEIGYEAWPALRDAP